MKKLILLIVLTVVTLPQLCYAEDEVIWETEKISYFHGVLVAPQGDILYNLRGKDLQIRRVDDGVVIDSIIMENIPNYLYQMSITDDGRYMAFSGDNPYVIIYDLQERKELKRITTIAYERDEYGKNVVYDAENWVSSSISPDGTKITGIVNARIGEMTNFVVIDIATEKVVFEQRRITYDHFNPDEPFYKWHSAEFSPDGKYIVSQLEFRSGSDSVYIYDANTFEVYDVVLNSYDNEYNSFSFSYFKPLFTARMGKRLIIYDLVMKEQKIFDLDGNSRNIVFSRNDDKIALQIGTTAPVIMDYKKGTVLDTLSYIGLPHISTKDNNLVYFGIGFKIALIKPNWNKITSVSDNNNGDYISPNPTTGDLSINFSNKRASFFHYDIISNSGLVVLSDDMGFLGKDNNNLKINISPISNGQYLLRIFSDQEEFVFNIIKEN
ncbi:MAG: T9SS type A sorting domain-containing protein [Candidatus Kapaibacterium sp.]